MPNENGNRAQKQQTLSIYSITEVNRYLKRYLDRDPSLQNIWLRGEISNFKHHNRGHMYFTLKDRSSRIRAVMFKGSNQYLKFQPQDGTEVIVRGSISVYEQFGQYQLYVKEMQPDGIGNLYLAFEQLKERLEKEGLFQPEKKRSLPGFPRSVGVMTSPTGAAVRDIVTTIRRRFPLANIVVYPVLVQGDRAAGSIVRALEMMNERREADVVILGRGGGSIEELWAFNEEKVARSIFRSDIPVISAVGHETDFTIADFVADVRAPTPTGAAELAVPHIGELKEKIRVLRRQLRSALSTRVSEYKERYDRLRRSYVFRHPKQKLEQYEQQLDYLQDKLIQGFRRREEWQRQQLQQLHRRLLRETPTEKRKLAHEHRERMQTQLERNMTSLLDEKRKRLHYLMGQLDALSPLKVMQRGYSLVYDDADKKIHTSVQSVSPGDVVHVRMKDGTLDCQVWGLEEGEMNHGES